MTAVQLRRLAERESEIARELRHIADALEEEVRDLQEDEPE
jgi:hypothetical protein